MLVQQWRVVLRFKFGDGARMPSRRNRFWTNDHQPGMRNILKTAK